MYNSTKQGFAIIIFLFGLTSAKAQISEKPLFKIAGTPVSKEEFYSSFSKSPTHDTPSNESLKEYLDLYINFRLKIKEAESLGMDTTAAFRQEFELYRNQLARNYLTDSTTQNKLIQEAYKRSLYDVRASHILIKLDPDVLPEDTIKAWKKITEAERRLRGGEDFGKVALEMSDDPSARDRQENNHIIKGNLGDLGYFTAFDMVYPFENVVYSLKLNKVSKPVRTTIGYHIVKLTDSIPAQGVIEVAHITLLPEKQGDPISMSQLADTAEMIYNLLQQGQDFAALANKYSDDKSTSTKGGVLPRFEVSRMVPEFITAVYSLKQPGDFSAPFSSIYGWHIIKLIDKKTPGSFDETKEELNRRIHQSDRQKSVTESFIQKVKHEYGFIEYQDELKNINTSLTDSIFEAKWVISSNSPTDKTLFQVGNKKYNSSDFLNYLATNQQKERKVPIDSYTRHKYKSFVDEACMKYADANLENKYPSFKSIIKEYHDGILLFTLNDKNVWSKSVSDTLGLQQFYETLKAGYPGPEELDAVVFTILDNSISQKLQQELSRKSVDPIKLASRMNKKSQKLLLEHKLYARGADSLIDSIKWEPGLSKILVHNGKQVIIKVNKVIPPEPRPLSEVKGIIIDKYQEYLDKKWIADLKAKYPVEINWEVFNSFLSSK